MGSDRNGDDPARWPDGVETYPADLRSYDAARQQLAQFKAPELGNSPNGRVFVACFDGTWNDKDKKPDEKTNVAEIYEQITRSGRDDVRAGYQSGVGTQEGWQRTADGALGYSYGPRMEQMYYDFCVQAKKWINENPNAEISLAATGFSRGAVTAAMFTRMVHERGIQNPEGMIRNLDPDGNIQSLTPTRPNLVPPGQTPQVVGLFDPVATGAMDRVDTRLPPSVVSGFQITALDEQRDLFRSKQIIDPGLSADGRFLAVQVAGAHSDLGGGYLLNGLAVRNGNLMMPYLNGTFGTPVLRERVVPTAPEMNVIHRSEQGSLGYTTALHGLAGERATTERLTAPTSTVAGMLYDHAFKNTDDAEPVNRQLRDSLRYRPVQIGPQREDPALPDFFRDRPQIPVKEVYDFSGPRPQREPSAPAPNYVVPGAQPKPLFEMPGYLQPDQKLAARGAEDIPALETVQVRPGPELTQGASATPPPTRSEAAPVSLPQAAPPQTGAPQIPDHLRDFRHPEHPRHPGFLRFMDGLEKVQAGYLQESRLPEHISPEHFERIAAALTAAQGMQPFFGEIGRVHQDKDGALWVSNLPPNLISEQPRWVKIDLADTLAQTPEAQATRWREQHVPTPAVGATQTQAQSVDPRTLTATDLRHPDHPRHEMYTRVRGALATEYERWGLMRDPAQLDRETAQVVVEARKQRIDDVGGIALSFPQGSPRDRPMLTLLEHPTHEFANRTSVDGDRLAQAPQVDQAGAQLQQVEQQVALMQQQEMQQRQEREMAQGQGRTV